jgi:alanine racemase
MISSSCIELSKSALRKNIRFLEKQIGSDVKYSSVVKANAYGHGIETFVPLAEDCGVRHFAVANAEEAVRVHNVRTRSSDIMIMGDVHEDALEWAIRERISFYIFDFYRLERALSIARELKIPARIHLELETGMNRTGLRGDWLNKALDAIDQNGDVVDLEGLCTHYAGAESVANYRRIIDQYDTYVDLCDEIERRGVSGAVRHTAASAAALVYPVTRMDMVRIGIAQYGYWPSKEVEMKYVLQTQDSSKSRYVDPLKRVLSWKSRVMSIKSVKQGEFIGYGTSYLTTRPHKVAAVPVGYFHGFRRSLSNLGRALIRGRRVAIVGYVNMSMLLINVTDVPNASVGDEVVLIGKQNKNQITVSSFSDMSNLLNYEVLVRIPSEIPRVIVD